MSKLILIKLSHLDKVKQTWNKQRFCSFHHVNLENSSCRVRFILYGQCICEKQNLKKEHRIIFCYMKLHAMKKDPIKILT